ncbi:RHS repeat-associated core domain-containing protein [Dyella sp.]|uniref:RHS repeat-associated core domain-containing protein n=1 Tax=Dyella sp. TaxID=1869338 RepID=UPI002847C93A|nr:RHS repeat-associated core domain-containing protein [Dyella sp.]MDR3443702.1 RHS repeat-associated core domain-containing protein [Dyella sp.]
MEGDPINTSTGNKFQQDTDYRGSSSLRFRRFYSSLTYVPPAHLGAHWRHSYDRSLGQPSSGPSTTQRTLYRPDGSSETFTKANGSWVASIGVWDTLTEQVDASGQTTGYTVFMAVPHETERYSPSGQLLSITDISGMLTSLTYSTVATPVNVAPTAGLLLTVSDPAGRSLSFSYDATSRVTAIVLPDGGRLAYSYDAIGNLASVTYPDTTSRQYVYNESAMTGGTSLPNAMTGVIDETGLRFENTKYEGGGHVIYAGFAGGADATTVNYKNFPITDGGPVALTGPLGNSTTLNFDWPGAFLRVTRSNQPCGDQCNQPWASIAYDANGSASKYTDFNNNVTSVTNNSVGLETQRIEAQGSTAQRTTTTIWDNTLRLPLTRTIADAKGNVVSQAGWTYNSRGQVLALCAVDPTVSGAGTYLCGSTQSAPVGVQQTRYTYCDAVDATQCPLVGLLLTATGARTNPVATTHYSYYFGTDESGCGTVGGACHRTGDAYQVANPLGQITTFVAYDKQGHLARSIGANGVVTDFTYFPRGWLKTRTVRANPDGSPSSGDATTTVAYTAYGAVASITDADGVTISYGYDVAHRRTDITDALGNRIHYTLDASGHRIQEQMFDPQGVARRTLSRTFNTLGQLTKVADGRGNAVFSASYADSYDANGNLVHTANALGIQRKQGFDALNRLVSAIDNYNGTDAATKNAQAVLAFDANNQLEGVSDPDGFNTTYSYDGLGNATGVQSPDTGSTAYVYDAAGNVTQRTDAKGVVSNSTYDALNRRTATTYADSTLNVAYAYDEANSVTGCPASYPVGRLTRTIETAITTAYCYDAHGNVTRKSQTQGTATDVTAYSYTLADRLASTLTPAGTSIQYSRDAAGRISGVTALPPGTSGAGAGNVVTAISYLPFGPIASYTLGNGQTITRTYDANYAVTDVVSPALNLHFARDAVGNITALGNASGANPATETYTYDPLYRLTGLYDASNKPEETYTYNKTGDRLGKSGNGLATGTYTYQTGTHHLTAIGNAARTYDANGNTTGSVIGGDTFGYGYNGRNRMAVVQRDGSTVGTYTYNVLGQRTAKAATFPAATSQRFAYDEASQLIGEYGGTSRDYVWLGNLPVATIDTASGVSAVSYVHVDGLNTPRAIADASGHIVWQLPYQTNGFGEQPPVSANGFTYNLRFPGQYYDAESGIAQNVNRDYEAATGRYLQSDPSGLNGGANTYSYVSGGPLGKVDPSGLQAFEPVRTEPAAEYIPQVRAQVEAMEQAARDEAREERLERAEAEGMLPGPRIPSSQYGEGGTCQRGDFDGQVGPLGRLPQDARINPVAPQPLPLYRPIGSSPTQNAALQADILDAIANGGTNFRVNQQQVDANGVRVGINRPDLQYTDATGQRVYIEYDTESSGRGPGHEARIKANDPSGQVIPKTVN